ncbi:MAG: Holliday junction resolvase RuvX [Candidatus Omnitrophica bacterium]|nr:Holliday junction resolvase RuvX [Candidatus Omnitrophota bacterium]
MKIIGLDLGEKRIGTALADEDGIIASAFEVIECNGKEIERIIEIVNQHEVSRIVYGMPLKMDGSLSPQGEKIIAIIEKLKEKINIMFIPWDERLTSKEAENFLLSANLSRKKRKKIIDKLSAQIILQSYLDSNTLKSIPVE